MHGRLRFGYQLEPYEWDEIKESWSRIDFDPFEPDWREKW
jgi:hypothetical protein